MIRFIQRKALLVAGWVALCASGPGAANAVVTFAPSNQLHFASMTVQSVVPMAGGYRMYLTSGGYQVLSATSTDHFGWTLEAGVRLATSSLVTDIDASSITSVGVYPSTAAGTLHRMFYVAISTEGKYTILSATSADGLTWGKSSTTYLRNGNGGFLDSPRPLQVSADSLRLFYTADNAGGNSRANYRIYSASSADAGGTLVGEGVVLAGDVAYQVAVTTLTDARTRLYYTAPLTGETTASQVLSAVSNNGLVFAAESGVRLSTTSSTAELQYPVVIRSTEAFRWRMFTTYQTALSTYSSDAVTWNPVLLTMTPTTILNSGSAVSFTFTGEVFGPATPAASFNVGGSSINATAEALSNDLGLTGTLNPLGQTTGNWNAVLTNPDGTSATLVNAFTMDIAPGETTIVDNVFRPLQGQSAQINIRTTGSGRIRLSIYSLSGGLVATLGDQDMPAGSHQYTWNGRTSSGNVVASGVYLLHIVAPRATATHKIVVIK